MRGRLLAFVIALALLAVAGIRDDDPPPTAERQTLAGSSLLADTPAPQPEPPVLIATTSTSAIVQTVVAVASEWQACPELSAFTAARPLRAAAYGPDKSRSFPLLI